MRARHSGVRHELHRRLVRGHVGLQAAAVHAVQTMAMRQFLADEWRALASLNRSDRPWEMPEAAALASGLPIFIGAAFGELALGLAASLGGLVFLHLPATRLSHRMAWLMACAFGMTASHALGLLGHLIPALVVPLLVTITLLVTLHDGSLLHFHQPLGHPS